MEQDFEHCLAQLKANQLSELDLSYKSLTDAQVIRLAEALKYNQSLTSLDLRGNRLGAAGVEKISAALKVNQTLTTLNLGDNQLGAAGAEKISAALKVNQTLTSLKLSWNKLGAAGVEQISAALKVNQTLTSLNLLGNQLSAAGAEKISAALKVNRTLTSLDLRYNELDNTTEQVIEEAVQTNRERIKCTRHQTLLTLVILLRHAHSGQSQLPLEIWEIIMKQLDFPSLMKGYRTSHAIASFLTQKNIFKEFNKRLQAQQSVRLVETHGTKRRESCFNFLTPTPTFFCDSSKTILPAANPHAEEQSSILKNK